MAVTVTVDDVVSVAPEFKDFAADVTTGGGKDQMEAIIEVARQFIAEDRWGTKAKLAIQFLAAHFLKDLGFNGGGGTGSSGGITSEKVGDLSRTYAGISLFNSTVVEQMFSSTKYGKSFLILRKTIAIGPMVT